MTRDFAKIACEILDILREEKNIKDVLLMARLGFTPDNWRHWRPYLIELFALVSYEKENSEDNNIKETVVYDKKQKLWTIQDV